MWALIWITFGLPQKYEQAPASVMLYEHKSACDAQANAFSHIATSVVHVVVEGKPDKLYPVRNVFKCVPAYTGTQP